MQRKCLKEWVGGWVSVLRVGGSEGAQGVLIPYQGTLHKMINIYTFFMALFLNFRAGGTLEMYGGLEISCCNGGRVHNNNELQLTTKMTQFREEYDNFTVFTVDKFAVLMLEPGSHQRPWRISGEISSLSLRYCSFQLSLMCHIAILGMEVYF